MGSNLSLPKTRHQNYPISGPQGQAAPHSTHTAVKTRPHVPYLFLTCSGPRFLGVDIHSAQPNQKPPQEACTEEVSRRAGPPWHPEWVTVGGSFPSH